MWVFIFDALLSWLVSFNVLNTRSQVVYVVGSAFQRLTRPILRPIRRYMPDRYLTYNSNSWFDFCERCGGAGLAYAPVFLVTSARWATNIVC